MSGGRIGDVDERKLQLDLARYDAVLVLLAGSSASGLKGVPSWLLTARSVADIYQASCNVLIEGRGRYRRRGRSFKKDVLDSNVKLAEIVLAKAISVPANGLEK